MSQLHEAADTAKMPVSEATRERWPFFAIYEVVVPCHARKVSVDSIFNPQRDSRSRTHTAEYGREPHRSKVLTIPL